MNTQGIDNIIQGLTLLSVIITITSGLLSITEAFREVGIVKSLFAVGLIILPIIFIQQLFCLAYCLQIIMIAINGLGIAFYIYFFRESKFDKPFVILAVLALSFGIIFEVELYLGSLGIGSQNIVLYVKQRAQFYSQLEQYKISSSMFKYLITNLYFSICSVLECTFVICNIMISARVVWFGFQDSSNGYDLGETFTSCFTNKLAIILLFNFFLMTGGYRYFIFSTMNLFDGVSLPALSAF